MTYKPVAYYIKDLVDVIRNSYTPEKVLPYYDFGIGLEVVNRLALKTDNPDFREKKYPLIWYLIKDSVSENISLTKAMHRMPQDITVIFCMETFERYSSEERYENSIIPILRPLYELFITELKKSKAIRSDSKFDHTYDENLFWGREGLFGHDGNIFNDRLDAIIIEFSDLSLIEVKTC